MRHHGRMKAYSEDLRRKVVEAVQQRGMGKSEAARTFGVSLSWVKRYVGKARQGESLSPRKHPGPRPKMDKRAKRLLEADVENWDSPTSTDTLTLRDPSFFHSILLEVGGASVTQSRV
jgi:transposase